MCITGLQTIAAYNDLYIIYHKQRVKYYISYIYFLSPFLLRVFDIFISLRKSSLVDYNHFVFNIENSL